MSGSRGGLSGLQIHRRAVQGPQALIRAHQGIRCTGSREHLPEKGATHLSFSSLVSQLRPPTNTLHSCLDMLRPCAGTSNGAWEAAGISMAVIYGRFADFERQVMARGLVTRQHRTNVWAFSSTDSEILCGFPRPHGALWMPDLMRWMVQRREGFERRAYTTMHIHAHMGRGHCNMVGFGTTWKTI